MSDWLEVSTSDGLCAPERHLSDVQGLRCSKTGETHDCAFLEPEALPPDLPPPVILMDC